MHPTLSCRYLKTGCVISTKVSAQYEDPQAISGRLAALQVVHSDLKALNILLTRGWEVAKIGDVGVARFMHAKDGSGEVAMGTFAYAAPETLLGIDSGVKVGRASAASG